MGHKMGLVVIIPKNPVLAQIGPIRARNDQKSGFSDFSKKPFLQFFLFLDPRHLPEGSYKFMFVRPSVRASVTAFLGIRSLDFSDFLHDDVVQ